jgi:predicted PurR-regulated permease PerM
MTQLISSQEREQEAMEAAAHGRQAWGRVGMRLRAITPSQIARFLLGAGVLALAGWLLSVSWVALLPFVLGGVMAYIMLPIVDMLDRFLPRWLASLLTMVGVTAVILLVLAQTVPLITRQVYNVAVTIPTEEKLTEYADELAQTVETLPAPAQSMVRGWLETAAGAMRTQLDSLAERGISLAVSTVLGLFDALGFVFGFLVIPTWLLTVLNEQKKGVRAMNRMLPDSVKGDFWAVIKIIDRAFSTFVRGQLFVGVVVGALTYLGLSIIVRLINLGGDYILVLSIFTGIMALIPVLGPFLGSIPVILLAWTISSDAAIAVTIMYVVIWVLVNNTVTSQIEERLIDIHPAILVIIIVAVSELGFLWVLLAAPIAGVMRDLFRYAYGRLADPPRPAGLLPNDPPPPETKPVSSRPVPIAYRHGRAQHSRR